MLRALSYSRRWSLDIGGLLSNFYCIHSMYVFGYFCFICLCVLYLSTNFQWTVSQLTWFFNKLRRTVFHYGYLNVFLIIKCAGYVKLMGSTGLIGQTGLGMSSYPPGA